MPHSAHEHRKCWKSRVQGLRVGHGRAWELRRAASAALAVASAALLLPLASASAAAVDAASAASSAAFTACAAQVFRFLRPVGAALRSPAPLLPDCVCRLFLIFWAVEPNHAAMYGRRPVGQLAPCSSCSHAGGTVCS